MDKSYFDLEDIYITSWLVLDYFSYGDRVIMNDFIGIGDYIACSEFMAAIDRSDLLMT